MIPTEIPQLPQLIAQPFFPQLSDEIWSLILHDFCDGSMLAVLLQVAANELPNNSNNNNNNDLQPRNRTLFLQQQQQNRQQQKPSLGARYLAHMIRDVAKQRLERLGEVLKTPTSFASSFDPPKMMELLESCYRACDGNDDDDDDAAVVMGHNILAALEKFFIFLEYVEFGVFGNNYREQRTLWDDEDSDKKGCTYFDWPVWIGELLWFEEEPSLLSNVTERARVVIYSPGWWIIYQLSHDGGVVRLQRNQNDHDGAVGAPTSQFSVSFCHHNAVPTPPMGRITGIHQRDKETLGRIQQRLLERNEACRGMALLPTTPTSTTMIWYVLSKQQATQRVARSCGSHPYNAGLRRILDATSANENELVCFWQFNVSVVFSGNRHPMFECIRRFLVKHKAALLQGNDAAADNDDDDRTS